MLPKNKFTNSVSVLPLTAMLILCAVAAQAQTSPVSITTTTLAPGFQSTAYSKTLAATGGSGTYTWVLTAGALPAGVSLSSTGVLSGTPTATGTFNFTVKATDTLTAFATQNLALLIGNVDSVFNGQQVNLRWNYPNLTTVFGPPQNATVGAGVEFPQFFPGNKAFNVDFADKTIKIDSNYSGSNFDNSAGVTFNGLIITNPGSGSMPPFTNVSLTAVNWLDNNGQPFASSRITFDSTHIFVDFQGMANLIGATITLTVNTLAVQTTVIPNTTVGFPYLVPVLAAGGSGAGRVFSVTAGALPPGLTLNASTGLISGTPTTAGTFTPTIQVTDNSGAISSQAYSVTVRSFGTINTRWQGAALVSFTGRGAIGVAGDTWTSFSTNTGTAVLPDSANQPTPVSVNWSGTAVVNSGNANGFCNPSPNQFCPLMNGYLGKTGGVTDNVNFSGLPANSSWDLYLYQQPNSGTGRQISVIINGTTTVSTTIPNNAADTSFILNKNYLIATATTDASGNFNIAYRGTAGDNEADINGLQLRPHLAPLNITQTTVPSGVQNRIYSTTLTTTGGTQTGIQWVVSAGNLPAGITLNAATGVVSGTPTVNGSFPFTALAVDSQNNVATQGLTLLINPVVSVTTLTLPTAVVGAAYSQTLQATGGFGAPYTWILQSGVLPAGLALNGSTGVISGTPTATGSTFTVQASDSGNNTAQRTLTITVNPAVSVTTTTLATGAIGEAYNQTLVATGGLGGYVWSTTSGALQAGLSLNASTGAISGTPTASGANSITFRATDTGGNFAPATITLTINAALSITTTSPLPQGVQGRAYNNTIATAGGLGTFAWTVTAGALPTGITLSGATGVLSGTPSAGGSFNFTIGVSDPGGASASQAFSLLINPPVSVTTTTLPAGVVGASYSQTLQAAGGAGAPYTWNIQTGVLPNGLGLNATSGVISGTPSTAGTFSFTAGATDPQGNFGSAALSIQVFPVFSFVTSALSPAFAEIPYTQTITVNGGFTPYAFAVTAGTLPAGLTLNPSTGVISGTALAAGSSTFTIQATDNSAVQITRSFTLLVNPPLAITTTTLPNAIQGTPYSQPLASAGGSGTLTWSFAAGTTASQAGLSINSSTGVLSGTPNTFGLLAVKVQVQDTANHIATQTLNLQIARQGNSSFNFVVSDTTAGKIIRMSSDGSGLVTICATVCHAGDIAADAQGVIYSHDTTGIYRITPAGAVTTILTRSSGVGGVTVDATGNIIFVDNSTDTVYRVTQAGVLTTVGLLPVQSVDELQDTAVALDAGGNYIVVSDDNAAVKIYRFTPAGGATTLATFPTFGVSGVTVTPTGIIEFIDYPHRQLVAFDPAGPPNNSTLIPVAIGDSVLQGIARDPANGQFIVGGHLTATVNRVTPAGAVTTLASGLPFAGPAGIAVVPIISPLTITTQSLPSGLVGQGYNATLSATGGSGSLTWTATNLPPGLFLSSGGVLSGGPTAAGNFNTTFTVTDVINNLTATAIFTITVTPKFTPVSLTASVSQVSVALGGAVSASFSVSGGTPPFTFSASGLPSGVGINSGTGAVSGSASSAGVFNATVSVSDSAGQAASTGLTVTVLSLNIGSLSTGLVGTAYNGSVSGIGGLQPYSVSATGLPPGLSIGGSTGAIGGTPTAGGTFTVTFNVSDAGGAKVSGSAVIVVLTPGAPVTISSGNLPGATVDVAYSQGLGAVGGKSPFVWAVISGNVPDGMSFGSNGILSGTPTTPGGYTFGVSVTDASGGTASTAAGLSVKAAPLSISSQSPLSSGINTVEYPSIQLAATGGVAPYKWSLSSGALPTGMTFDAGGTVSGTPTAVGSFTLGAAVADAAGNKATASFALTIRPLAADLILSAGNAAFSLTTGAAAVPSGQAVTVQSSVVAQQIGYSAQVSPAVPWLAVTNGTKTPDSISLAVTNAALSLPAGDYSTSVKATCGTGSCAGNAQTVNVTLNITSPPPRLKVATDILSFSTTTQSLSRLTAPIALRNVGGGSLGVASVTCLAPWCTAGSPPAFITGGASANVPVTVNPAAVTPGFYRTTVEITSSGGKGSVPVTLFVAANSTMTLAPSGSQYSAPQGGAPGNSSGSFLVGVNSTAAVNFTVAPQPGADWLKVGVSTFSASSAQPGTVPFSVDPVIVSTLAPGAYYGQISVGGAGMSP